jgi:hypothetical protein
MIFGYYDKTYPDLMPGDNALVQTNEINNAIASTGHYDDYAVPMDGWTWEVNPQNPNGHWVWVPPIDDKSSTGGSSGRPDDCLADYMLTSRSYYHLAYGESPLDMMDDTLVKYTSAVSGGRYRGVSATLHQSALTWKGVQAEVTAGRPMAFVVDTDANGDTDHIVAVIGYCELGGAKLYAFYSTWDNTIWWGNFDKMHNGNFYGVYAGVMFEISLTTL